MTTPNSLDNVPNPFDFANPVSRKQLFAGRKREREDIQYYLKQAVSAPRAINLAILGARASGKTSLLNIIELEAGTLGLPTVRIDLNESDAESQLNFCYKLFDSVLSKIVEEVRGDPAAPNLCFGGPHGRTYDEYLDMTSSFSVPDDKTFCPFIFPIQYAKAHSSRTGTTRISDHILRRDLARISEEVQKPIVILVDECNVLCQQRALLEMVRNTFMNLPGYMLVFAGTPDLFPVMDEVFSPIVRQFKKIEVSPFGDIKETLQCITEPLNSIDRGATFPIHSIDHLISLGISKRA